MIRRSRRDELTRAGATILGRPMTHPERRRLFAAYTAGRVSLATIRRDVARALSVQTFEQAIDQFPTTLTKGPDTP